VSPDAKPRTAAAHGRLWGARARDWSELVEPRMQPVYEAAFARVGFGAGMRYLDVGCGAGFAARLAARRGALVSGLDAAENMLAIARERVPEGDFRLGDIEELPFPDHNFDVITGFNSFQFAGNPETAFAQARRVAKPSAMLAIVTWDRPEGMEAALLLSALKPLLPPAPAGAPSPFALSDEAVLHALVERAGLTRLETLAVDAPLIYPDLDTALRALRSAGGSAKAMELAGVEAVDGAHKGAIAPFRRADGSYRVHARFRCLFCRP